MCVSTQIHRDKMGDILQVQKTEKKKTFKMYFE